jgi:transposase-like protein
MTETRMALGETLRKGAESEGGDFLRESLRWLIGELMEAEVSAQSGAERYERTDERATQRNG